MSAGLRSRSAASRDDEPQTAAPQSRLTDEIVRCALDMFNRRGAADVSTNAIAARLGISSGNLHYHFRTKNDLSRVLYEWMERDLRHVLRDTDGATLAHIVTRQIDVQRCLWRHRYFFAGMDALVRKDAAMLAELDGLQRWAIGQIERLLVDYTPVLGLRPIDPPNTPFLVAQNIWMLWTSWVRWEVVLAREGERPPDEDAVVDRLVERHFSFLAILMPQPLAVEVRRELDIGLTGDRITTPSR